MLQRMVLKRVLVEMVRLENATKKQLQGGHCGIREVDRTSVNTITEVAVCKYPQHDIHIR